VANDLDPALIGVLNIGFQGVRKAAVDAARIRREQERAFAPVSP
jgi:hypothetical protein